MLDREALVLAAVFLLGNHTLTAYFLERLSWFAPHAMTFDYKLAVRLLSGRSCAHSPGTIRTDCHDFAPCNLRLCRTVE